MSYFVMLASGIPRAMFFLLFLAVGGHPLLGDGSASTPFWLYVIYSCALPVMSAFFYFKWPWGPVLVCWFAMALNLAIGFPPEPQRDTYYTQIAFLLAAHLGLVSYVFLKLSGLWPFKTHKEVAVSREQIVGE